MSGEFETRERIMDHARERFLRQGFSKVTMDELSADLGMSKKTFYKFFPSKEELLRTIVFAMMKGVEREMELIENSDKPFAEQIAEVMVLLGKNVERISRVFQLDIQRFAPALWKEVEAFRLVPQVELIKHFASRQANSNTVTVAADVNADTNLGGGWHYGGLRKSKPV